MLWKLWLSRSSKRPSSTPRRQRLHIESLEHREVPASLSGTVFKDFNNDGTLSSVDSPLSGVTVSVSGGSLTTPQTTTTGSDGTFSLTGLAAGTYTLTTTAPTGTVAGKSIAGTATGTGSTSNSISNITLTADQVGTGYLFGEVPTNLTIGGKVYDDANGNGTQDTGENGIAGVTVTLNGTSVTDTTAITPKTATTTSDGSYSFTNLVPGTYSITETPASGYARGTLQNGTPAASSSTTSFTGIDLATAGTSGSGYNFGDVKPASISLTQTVSAGRIKAGSTVTITLVAKNNGGQSISDISAAINLDGLTFVSANGTGFDSTQKNWSIGTLDAGQSATLVITATAPRKGEYLPASRLVTGNTSANLDTAFGAATSANETAFNRLQVTSPLFSLKDFLASSFSSNSSTANLYPTYPTVSANQNTGPTTPTVTFYNAAGDTANTSGSTTETTTVIKGTTSANTAVTLVETNASTTSDANGAYSFSAVPLNVGANTFTVKAGTGTNTSQAFGTLIRTSTTAPTTPTVTFYNAAGDTLNTSGSTSETTAVIKGNTSANTTVTLVETNASTTSDANGAYSFSAVPLNVGANTFTVKAGTGTNTSQATGTLTRTSSTTTDTPPIAPTVTFYNAAGTSALNSGSTTEATTVIKGVTSANTAITLVETGATTTSDSNGAYTFSGVTLATGANTFTVKAGTGSLTIQTSGSITRNSAPTTPTITFFNSAGDTQLTGTSTNEGTTVIKGTTSPNTDLSLVETGAIATSDENGAYSFSDVPVVVGSNTYTIKAGTGTNTSQAVGTLTGTATSSTPTAPTIQFFNAAGDTQITNGSTNEGSATINGLTSPNTNVTLVETSDTTTSDSAGAYSFTGVPVIVGTNTYTVRATGDDGTSRKTSATLTGTATSSTPTTPTVQFFNAAGDTQITSGSTSEATTVIKGVTTANATLSIVQTSDTATADANGNFTFDAVPVTAGVNTYTIRATGDDNTTSQTIVTLTGAVTSLPITPTVRFYNAAGSTELTSGTTTESTTVIKGVTSANTPLTLVETGANTTSDSSGAYSFTGVSLVAGSNSFTVKAGTGTNVSQTVATLSRTAVTPTTPTVTFYNAAGTTLITNGLASESTTTIKGVTSPNTPVTIVETSALTTSDNNGAYTFSNVPVVAGTNTYTVKAGTGTTTSQASGTLTSNSAPTISNQQADVALSSAKTSQLIDLAGKFTDANLGTTKVKFTTSLGDVNIDLYDKAAPQTVANFLNYVTSGDYNNSIFHRSVSGFVLQGGGFAYDNTGGTSSIKEIPTDPAVQNEPDSVNRSNVAGTIAMAKLGGDPNSATDQFFFNLTNNASNLDNQNGGFTVFGKLSSTADQAIVNALAAIPVSNQSNANALPSSQKGVFDSIPLRNYTGTNFPTDTTLANYAAITSAMIVSQPEALTYSVVNNSNTGAVTATIVNNRLTVAAVAGQTGTATITVRATDKGGLTKDMTFNVTVS